MAGLYITLGAPDMDRIEAAAARLRFFDEEIAVHAEPGFCFAWVGHDPIDFFGPALEFGEAVSRGALFSIAYTMSLRLLFAAPMAELIRYLPGHSRIEWLLMLPNKR